MDSLFLCLLSWEILVHGCLCARPTWSTSSESIALRQNRAQWLALLHLLRYNYLSCDFGFFLACRFQWYGLRTEISTFLSFFLLLIFCYLIQFSKTGLAINLRGLLNVPMQGGLSKGLYWRNSHLTLEICACSQIHITFLGKWLIDDNPVVPEETLPWFKKPAIQNFAAG